jgi:hypothetical protein
MTDRTDVQTNCIDAYANKTGAPDDSVTPAVVSGLLQVMLDKAAMLDEVIPASDLLDIFNTRCEIGNTSKTSGDIAIVITGTGSEDLYPPDNPQPVTGGDYEGFVKVTGLQSLSEKGGLSVSGSDMVVGIAGDYYTSHAFLDLSSGSNANNVGFIIAIERTGFITFSERTIGARASNAADRTNVSGGGFLDGLEVGDKISVWVASEKNTTLTIFDANLGVNLRAPASLVT